MKAKRGNWVKMLFAAYCIVMLWLLFGQRLGQSGSGTYWQRLAANLNLVPMDTVNRFLWVLKYSQDGAQIRHAVINLVGNVVMFVPLGYLSAYSFPKMRKFWRNFPMMVLIILAIEGFQLVTLLGSCDVDDLILNLVGTTIGFLIWKITQKH